MTEPRNCCRKHWQEDVDQLREALDDLAWFEPARRMIVCPTCGDKRCPRAEDCSMECTGEAPKCETCGVPRTEHLGIMGTCRALQDSLAREANYREQIDALMEQRNEAQAGRRLAEEIAAGMEVERDEARKMRDALFVARDKAVEDGVFWKQRCDELLATLAEIECEAGEYADLEADPLDESPSDMHAWRNGVIVQMCEKAREA